MISLGIDTTGAYCSLALVDSISVYARSCDKIKRGHAEHIGPQLQALFKRSGHSPRELSRISVCIGPGSFTGLRVGIAIAKGLALPRKTPIIGISALEVWAASLDPEQCKKILTVADVRRGEIFTQIYKSGKAEGPACLQNLSKNKGGLNVDIEFDAITGNGAHLVDPQTADHDGYVDPAILAWLGLNKNPAAHPPAPLYHRPADAKLPGGITPPVRS